MDNKTPKIITLIGVGILLFCSGCHFQFYDPPTVHEPKFQKEGELHTAVTISDLHLAYSPVNNLGIMLSGYLWQGINENIFGHGSSNICTSLSSLDMGLGGYTDLGKNWNFSLYSGGGLGTTSRKRVTVFDSQTEFAFQTKRLFIQPGLYYIIDGFSFDVNLRFTKLFYSNLQTIYSGKWVNELNNHFLLIFEPAFTFNSKFKWVDLFLQLSPVTKLNNVNVEEFEFDSSIFTFGISKNFNLKD